jgi:hypothetical protein
VQRGEQVGKGLTRAGAGTGNNIAALKGLGDGFRLRGGGRKRERSEWGGGGGPASSPPSWASGKGISRTDGHLHGGRLEKATFC